MRQFFSKNSRTTSSHRKASLSETQQQDQDLNNGQWPREAVLIDGKLRWCTNQGVGDPVSGSFDFVHIERDNKFMLSPQGWKVYTEKHGPPAHNERSIGRHLQKTDLHDVEALAEDLAQSFPPGIFHAHASGSTISTQDLSKKYLRSLLRSGRKPKGEAIAVDSWGNLDVDHDIDGPEISPEGQIGLSP